MDVLDTVSNGFGTVLIVFDTILTRFWSVLAGLIVLDTVLAGFDTVLTSNGTVLAGLIGLIVFLHGFDGLTRCYWMGLTRGRDGFDV